MTRRYTYATELSFGGDEPTWEGEVEVSFTVEWGSPPTGMSGPPENYDPGSGTLIEDIRVETIDGKPAPWNCTAFGDLSDKALIEAEALRLARLCPGKKFIVMQAVSKLSVMAKAAPVQAVEEAA